MRVSALQWGRDVSIPEIAAQVASRWVMFRLHWGRDVSIPEIATPLLYSIFKDLRALPRAPLHFKPTIHSRTILSAANPRRSKPLPIRERSPLNPPRPAARTRLPRRKHRVFRNLPLQYPRQQLSLIHISEPTRQAEISYAVFCL